MRVDITNLSHDEFLELRTGIGGSDAGIILGLSEYTSKYELWGLKTGLYTREHEDNKYSFFGRYWEDGIVDLYQYWDKDFDQMIVNYNNKKKVVEVEDKIYHYTDDELDFLQCSPDRIVTKHPKWKGSGVLEVKTIAGYVADKYASGLPPQYYAQIQHNMMVTGLQWGEFVIMKDGRDLDVFHIKRDDKFIESLKEKELDFWARVVKTREAVEKGEDYSIYEPEIDGTQAFTNFLKDKFKGGEETIIAEEEDIISVLNIEKANHKIKEFEDQKRLESNKIQFRMKNAVEMLFDKDEGITVSWRPDRNGVRRFLVKVK